MKPILILLAIIVLVVAADIWLWKAAALCGHEACRYFGQG